jgi:glycosyltransferase involved in cell wall biosynthesis
MDLAKSLDVFDATRFVGWIQNDKLPDYLSPSDVYVSTSLSDGGVAVSTLEAMACELPCIVTNVGDNNKWIKNGENGFIVPTKDPKALAGKIIYLLENEDIRMTFGKKNRKIIEEKQDYYKEMLKMENIYIELVKRYKS